MEHPQYAVSLWIGHSITVSGKHYVNSVPDELYERAARGTPANDAPCAQRNAQRQASETGGNERKLEIPAARAAAQKPAISREIPLISAHCA